METRYHWSLDEVLGLLEAPLDELCQRAREIHRKWGQPGVQKCELLSIKTGGCADNCSYCSQSAHHRTCVEPEPLVDLDSVVRAAVSAREKGASRLCMGAAWKTVPLGGQFSRLLEMIRSVSALGLEVCGTFGRPTEEQLLAMKEAGLNSYNHNLDTSRCFYPQIVTTRTYDERLETLGLLRKVGIQICCGGIIGMGETLIDRAMLLCEIAALVPHPESVPINMLVPVAGTPLENSSRVSFEEFLRVVAAARIMLPRSRVRLSAGRHYLTEEEQLKCFEAGADSIFIGDKLLTTPNVSPVDDNKMLSRLR